MKDLVQAIEVTAAGGVLYKNSSGQVIGTGSKFDRAAVHPLIPNTVLFYSLNSDRTLIGKANGAIIWSISTPTGATLNAYTVQGLLLDLATLVFTGVSAPAAPALYYPPGYYTNFHPGKYATNQNVFKDRIYGSIAYINQKVKIDRVKFAIATASAGNGVTGIYKYNGTTWDRVITAPGTMNLASNTEQEIVFLTKLTLEPGIYSFVVNLQNDTILASITNDAVNLIFGWANTYASNSNSALVFGHTYSGSLPNNINANIINAYYNTLPQLLYKITT